MRFIVRALLTVFCASTAAGATVTGTVTAAPSGGALQSIVVAAYDLTGQLTGTASTDVAGLYVLPNVNDGEYRLLAYDPAGVYATAFDANAESFETTPVRAISSSGAQVSFTLVKGGAVAGGVQTAGGFSIAGAMVEAYNLSGTRRGFTATNSTGDYSLTLPPGEYKLVAYDPGAVYAVTFHQGSRSFAEATPVRVTEGQPASVMFALGLAARLIGMAVADNLLPLPSILLYAYTPAGALVSMTTTDASGVFRFSLPAGDYRIVAADASRVYATAYYDASRSFEGASVVTLAAGQQRQNVQVVLTRGARITGHVNAPDLLVAAYNLDGTLHASTKSDAAGDYTLVIASGEVRISVSDPLLRYATLFYGGTADFRFATTLVVAADVGGIDVTLPRGGHVSGAVRLISSAQSLGGITVAAYDDSGTLAATATTGADGRYAMVVAPGRYRFLAFDVRLNYGTSHAGGATSYETTVPLAVDAGAMITADFTMAPGVRVGGLVRSSAGDELTGIEVFALDTEGDRAAGAVSKDGAFAIVVAPGTYRFGAVDPLRRHAPAEPSPEVVVAEGQTPPMITLTLPDITRRRSVRH